jgi:hypothetical protein
MFLRVSRPLFEAPSNDGWIPGLSAVASMPGPVQEHPTLDAHVDEYA